MIQSRKTWQNTDRIARIIDNMVICRTFLRSVLLWVIDPQKMVTDRHDRYRPRIDRLEMSRFAGLSPDNGHRGRCGRYFFALSLVGHERFACILLPERCPCTWQATTSTPTRTPGGRPARCRVRIYLPEDVHDTPAVICSELPNNPGGSITNSVEVIAAGVIRANELPTPLMWIEHWPKESTDGRDETFELVDFSSYEVTERAPYLGETGRG